MTANDDETRHEFYIPKFLRFMSTDIGECEHRQTRGYRDADANATIDLPTGLRDKMNTGRRGE